jgi:glycosyltransferase involved in cell wall biosynthesis
VTALLAAYAQYRASISDPLPLVLAGAVERGAAGVRVERAVTAERLAALYAGAAALVHPSLYEGFGLTVLEAMAAGTPVIAADAPGVREVAGEAAVYVDPRDPAAFAAAMTSAASDDALRRRLGGTGRERARAFSWATSAEAHAEAYSLALRA